MGKKFQNHNDHIGKKGHNNQKVIKAQMSIGRWTNK
jgi:hypothetical protein